MSVLLSTAVSQWLVARKSKNTTPFPPVCQLDLCLCCLCCLSHCLLLEDPQLLIAVPSVCCGLLCQREGCCSIQGFLQSTFLPQHRPVSTCRYCLGLQTLNATNMTFRKPYLKALKLSKVIQIRPFCLKAFYFSSPTPAFTCHYCLGPPLPGTRWATSELRGSLLFLLLTLLASPDFLSSSGN